MLSCQQINANYNFTIYFTALFDVHQRKKKSEEKAKCNEFEFKKNSALSLLT